MNSSNNANFNLMQTLEINETFELACRFINETQENIFVTGNAGTGKTSFLRHIIANSPKNMVVAAPTGIAALNAGGVTLHSLFQLPFAPFIPTEQYQAELIRNIRQNKTKLDILRNMDVLIIDEISMVRCDVLDAIDTMLRSVRRNHKLAFGGVQVLFIGDLNQLPPVVKPDEWQLLSAYYKSPYFFESKVLGTMAPICIEFTKIYRQKESSFIELLNKVRNNALTPQDIKTLNNNYNPDFDPPAEDNYIILTSHNARAERSNQAKLDALKGRVYTYSAEIEDDFPEYLYPNDPNLALKIGAQVMFIKNDNVSRQYFNGKIGTVHSCNEDTIEVDCKGELISVSRDYWENTKYSVADGSSTIQQQTLGRFIQFPLKLAWAITIHKSQGLTFEKVMIDAAFSFSSGQVYVALSRCTSLKGIVLLSRIENNAIVYDHRINEGVSKLTFQGRIDEYLLQSKKKYGLQLMIEILDCEALLKYSNFLYAEIRKWGDKFTPESLTWAGDLRTFFTNQQVIVDKFIPSLRVIAENEISFDGNDALLKRLNDAMRYFLPLLEGTLSKINDHKVSTELKEPSSKVSEYMNEIFQMLSQKLYIIDKCLEGFNIVSYLGAKTTFNPPKNKISVYNNVSRSIDEDDNHGLLHGRLKKWRDTTCKSLDLPVYLIGNAEMIKTLASYMPVTEEELMKVRGFGPAKAKRFGPEILDIITSYCDEFDITPDRTVSELEFILAQKKEAKKSVSKDKKEKINTRTITLQLWKTKKTITEIAEERSLAKGTIEYHLAELVSEKEISVFDLIQPGDVEKVIKVIEDNRESSLTELKHLIPEEITFGQLRAVKNHYELTK